MRSEFRDIVREVSGASSVDAASEIIVQRVKASLPVDFCAIYLTDVDDGRLVRMAASGLSLSSTIGGATQLDRETDLLNLVVERRELVVLANAMAYPLSPSSFDIGDLAPTGFLGMPLIHSHRVLGVLAAWKTHPPFHREEVTFFVTLAAQLARVIHEAVVMGKLTTLLNRAEQEDVFIQGVHATSGLALGTATLLDPLAKLESVPDQRPQNIDTEEAAFRAALSSAEREVRAAGDRITTGLSSEVRDLFEVYSTLLGSHDFVDRTIERIRSGNWAPGAWRATIDEHLKSFDNVQDAYLRARADDIREIGQRVFLHLQSEIGEVRRYPERCILVGDRISITDMANVPSGRLVGVVCRYGSALSHIAILARAMGIPAVVSLSSLPLRNLEGRTIAVDGDQGQICVQPSPASISSFERRISEHAVRTERLKEISGLPAETKDGIRIPLLANIGFASDIEAAQANGAEGVGLYRTEYQFILGEAFPIEDEQYEVYRQLSKAFTPMPVTVRTLDVGGDKILPYFPVQEDNPLLGCRGIRFSLEHPDIFMIQLRALLRANAEFENLQVLFPMVARIGEVSEAVELLNRAHRELRDEGKETAMPRTGVMIEVPSAVFLTRALAECVDFLSIGTNDLAQYTLAADRNNEQVVTPYDSFHPAVLHAIHKVVQGAHDRGRPVSVCGEMAGDPSGALVLLGMGIDALSMSSSKLLLVKLVIRSFGADQARLLFEAALREDDEASVHRLLKSALEEAGISEASGAI